MRKLKVAYCNSLNFGDALSPYIVGKLSGLKISGRIACATGSARLRSVLSLLRNLLLGHTNELILPQMGNETCVMAVGSILGWGNARARIWGCGFIEESDNFYGGHIYALGGGIVK